MERSSSTSDFGAGRCCASKRIGPFFFVGSLVDAVRFGSTALFHPQSDPQLAYIAASTTLLRACGGAVSCASAHHSTALAIHRTDASLTLAAGAHRLLAFRNVFLGYCEPVLVSRVELCLVARSPKSNGVASKDFTAVTRILAG